MPDFKAARNRDAWFVIRGYKYQIDHSILKWLRLDDDQLLVLESGEDIDIVNTALSRGSDGFDRTLEQIKHLDSPITLRVDAAKIAIANATQHRVSNPSLRLLFRFCTNATITSERPLLFEDRAPGIDIWEKLRTEQIAEPDRTRRLNKLLTFLRKLKKPAKGIDPTTWTTFTSFCSSCSLEELGVFIHAFEWSAVEPNMDDVSSEIRNYLHVAFDVPREQAQAVYSKLFLHIVQLLSQRGTKQLAAAALTPFLANPTLSASDAALLAFVQNQVLLHSVQLERLESASRTNEQAIAELREKFMEMAYGPAWSLNLSAAVAEIATTLPPQVRPIARRTAAIQTLKAVIQTNAWTAIYGSVGCGKTQLAALLGDQVQPIVYVSLRDLNPSEANFFLHHLFVQLCADHRTGTITRSALTALEVGTILILDDIPRVIPGDQLARRLVEIASVVHVRNQHLVSLSHHALPQSVVTAKGISTFSEIVAPRLIRDDVLEMLTQHDAPAQVATPVTIDALLTVTSGNPTLLAAAIRTLRSQEWRNVDEQLSNGELVSAINDGVSETTFRLLGTVEDEHSRELLYRLCVVIGSFGTPEVELVSHIEPTIVRPAEKYTTLQGLWVEQQSLSQSVVCPLIATFGGKQLAVSVECEIADSLADAIFDRTLLSPIDFSKGVRYLSRAQNGVSLGMCVIGALGSVSDLPLAWQKLVLSATLPERLMECCPKQLALMAKLKQIQLASAIKEPLAALIDQGRKLLVGVTPKEMWAAVSYAFLAAPIVAKHNFGEAVELYRLVLNEIATVNEFQSSIIERAEREGALDSTLSNDLEGSLVWFLVTEVKTTDDFGKWFDLVTAQPVERVTKILASDLAVTGMRLAVDLLWMNQHVKSDAQRDFRPILAAYDMADAYFARCQQRVLQALVVRAKIIVFAEYLNDLPKAVDLSERFLASGSNSDEILFLITTCVGSQYLYAGDAAQAINRLKAGCSLQSGRFKGMKCRAFIELSSAIGEADPEEALAVAEKAVRIAEDNPCDVPELDMVSSLGEASLAAWLAEKPDNAFDLLDKAFTVMSRSFESTDDWKMRHIVLGNMLSYMATMLSSGKPPEETSRLPPRGRLIGCNDTLARWYDSRGDRFLDLGSTLLVVFATETGREHRALFWANKGIDEARKNGNLPSVNRCAEALVPNLLTLGEIDRALDYAYESVMALVASKFSYENGQTSVLDRKDPLVLLGAKPNKHWNQVECLYVWNGIMPSLVTALTSDVPNPKLVHLSAHCKSTASDASNPTIFDAIAASIDNYLLRKPSMEFHARARAAAQIELHEVAAVDYLLSSLAEDAPLARSIIQQTLVLHHFASSMGESLTWSFVATRLATHWAPRFEAQRFAFLNPSEVSTRIAETLTMKPRRRIRKIIQAVMAGLNVRLPEQLEATSVWLNSDP